MQPPLPPSGDFHGWGLIIGQFAAPFAVDHTQCQIPHTRDGIHNGQGGGGGGLHLGALNPCFFLLPSKAQDCPDIVLFSRSF